MPELTDLDGGRCYVVLSDDETYDEMTGCFVRFCTEEEDDARVYDDPGMSCPKGYRDISIEDLVRHYLATKV